MRLLKEFKLIHWPKPVRIFIEYMAVLLCIALFSGVTFVASYTTMYILSLI